VRLTVLFLRSRLAGPALVWLVAAALLAWLCLVRYDDLPLDLTTLALPLLPAVVIGVTARSPFGDAEEVASRPLPLFRVLYLAGLLVIGIALLIGAASVADIDLRLALARTLVGYTGLALLCGRVLGYRLAWLAPLAYAAVTLYLDTASRWAWPKQLPVESWSLFCGLLLGALGLLAAAQATPGDQPDDL
jgi:hypothetical protein